MQVDHAQSLTYNTYSMFTTILTDRLNFAKDVKDIRQQWLGDLLHYIGIDTEELLDMPPDIAVEYLVYNDIEITEYKGIDAMEVKLDGQVIGEWGGPVLTMKEDDDKVLYYEAKVEHWSIIEEEIDELE